MESRSKEAIIRLSDPPSHLVRGRLTHSTAMHHDFDVVSLTCDWYHGVLLWAVNLAYRWQRISIP